MWRAVAAHDATISVVTGVVVGPATSWQRLDEPIKGGELGTDGRCSIRSPFASFFQCTIPNLLLRNLAAMAPKKATVSKMGKAVVQESEPAAMRQDGDLKPALAGFRIGKEAQLDKVHHMAAS